MNRPIIKFIADFGPLFIFFIIYFSNDNDLKLAIPPFIIATLISLAIVYFIEKKIPIMPLVSGVLITLFGGLTLYFNNKGLAKLSIGIGRGKKKYDKRASIKAKEWDIRKQKLQKNKVI